MILIIDNYDSFTYNLVQLVGQRINEYRVIRNDECSIRDLQSMKLDAILLSPGPGRPENAGICVDIIRILGQHIPILGVCLGHQAIGYAFGGKIVHAPKLMHGKTSMIHHHNESIFSNLSNPFVATRYHSLIIDQDNFPKELQITATADNNIIMGVRHTTFPIEGIQFHPESILTIEGPRIIENWIAMIKKSS